MILRIAWKNFVGQGMRAFLNTLVTALTLVAVVFNISLYNGFQGQATRNMIRTDVAGGHYRMKEFDILTPTQWEDHTFTVPDQIRNAPSNEKAEVLVLQGQIFPKRRLFPVQLRGIEIDQSLIDLPFDKLRELGPEVGENVAVVIGQKMADKAHLDVGDTVVMKWRDKYGVVDARDVYVADVVPIINPRIDEGLIWLRLDHLRQLTARPNEVSWVAVNGDRGPIESLEFLSQNELMRDILNLIKQDRQYAKILWVILIFLAGIGVFNTQILNIFKRQKEIGTLMALGMTPRQVVTLFTLEGSLAALISVLFAVIFGTLIFSWFQSTGLDISHLRDSNIPVNERILLEIKPLEVLWSTVSIVSIMILVSWFPVRKISRLDPTLALRGKGIT
jgi:ABC-type lipoprotein release transport system permease subunit